MREVRTEPVVSGAEVSQPQSEFQVLGSQQEVREALGTCPGVEGRRGRSRENGGFSGMFKDIDHCTTRWGQLGSCLISVYGKSTAKSESQ